MPVPDNFTIHNARIVTCDPARRVLHRGALSVQHGIITALEENSPKLAPPAINAQQRIIIPGLINTHCHAADSLFRGLVENLPLEPWLQQVWRAEGAILDPHTTYSGALLGLGELLLSGVTTVMDMFWFPEQSVAAAHELGMRISTGGLFFDAEVALDGKNVNRVRNAKDFFLRFAADEQIFSGVFPHGAYTVGPDSLQAAAHIAREYQGLFSIHAAETRFEQRTIQERYGCSVIRHLDKLGLLDRNCVLAHCVHLDKTEVALLARSGAHVAHCPLSNLKLGSGIAPIPDLLRAGVNVTLGTDGAISGNDLDLWCALRLAATLHKGVNEDATLISTQQAFDMVTCNGAQALGASDRIGSLEVGKAADFVVLEITGLHATPLFDPLNHLVFSANRNDVRDVFVGGKQLVANHQLLSCDLTATLNAVRALEPRILASVAEK